MARNIEVAPESVVEGETLGYGTFHVSRALGFLLVEDNWGFNYEADVIKILNTENLEAVFQKAIYEIAYNLCLNQSN